ncbi:MAG: acyl-CoA thioesterase, partial [Glaciimonas sp.]|nr:acyl-CoA thioesterase [Glaciimonas sp.]
MPDKVKVPPHECDINGGLTHALYLDYLKQARCAVLMDLKFLFEELKVQKIGFVVLKIDLDYLASLMKGDDSIIETTLNRISMLRLGFAQIIYRVPDKKFIST